jgi:hypothetical protein
MVRETSAKFDPRAGNVKFNTQIKNTCGETSAKFDPHAGNVKFNTQIKNT